MISEKAKSFLRACNFGNWCSMVESNNGLGDCFFGGKCGCVNGVFMVKDAKFSPRNEQAVQYKTEAQMWETSLKFFMETEKE